MRIARDIDEVDTQYQPNPIRYEPGGAACACGGYTIPAQGLRESFDQFADLLAQNLKVSNSAGILDKDQMLASLQTDHQSVWELATRYFCNFTVISSALMILYVLVHILLCRPRERQGLEFNDIDLPDSLGELVTCAILVFQLERVFNMVSHFVQARLQRETIMGSKPKVMDGCLLLL